ncbi:hypothetical protein GQ651_09085 [Alphaproteobacteria bacterium GH1-50]|uniref:Uncharacterized protein n=1 Tax=Kangsaoukella pontilimi TaxID=2691042 RepID=A0A7C9N066_9RHOB|nr:hypothetical protein [Kangsaoukella pontilimi]MXQ07998.1 hypothetical protein [Kangsaoukella pontilimi]
MGNGTRSILSWGLIATGSLAALFGVWAIATYVIGVIRVLDAPDRSWIFWGLAIMMIGIIALAAGIPALVAGLRMRQGGQSRDR